MGKIFNFKRNKKNAGKGVEKRSVEKRILAFSFSQRLIMNTGVTIIGPIIPIVAAELAVIWEVYYQLARLHCLRLHSVLVCCLNCLDLKK
jgi:hypothetical protein